MKFAVFYEITVPRPWTDESERTVYENSLEQIRLADELGFQTVWIVEHHFFEEHSHMPQPDLFLAAAARETKNIRLGHAIVQCIPNMNHPVNLAERGATLDLLSGGRLDYGTGRGSAWLELAGFGVNPDDTKRSWDEYIRVIPKMWTEERFGYSGQFFNLPRRTILPKPYQKPHPPMWVATSDAGEAGDRGLGMLLLSFTGYKVQAERIAKYRERIAKCEEPVGAFINNRTALVNFLYCHEDNEVAVTRGKQVAARYLEVFGQAYGIREVYPTRTYPSLPPQWALQRGELETAERGNSDPGRQWQQQRSLKSEEPVAPEGLCAGDPAHVIEAARGWEATGVDELGFLLNAGEAFTQEEVLDSLRLFAAEVMPAFEEQPAAPGDSLSAR